MDEELRAMAERAMIATGATLIPADRDEILNDPAQQRLIVQFAALVAEHVAEAGLCEPRATWYQDGTEYDTGREDAAATIRALAARWRGAPGVER